ncbi:MAG: hypothetical protein V5B40_14835, partial [Candidatus Accumulibacter meliphilus]
MNAFLTRSIFALAILLISPSLFAQSANPTLTVDSERGSHSLSLDELRDSLETREIEVINPDLGRPVSY